ncbi:arsenic resistance N-acetyltransferase ArsN2 [Agrobacterium larrymoorei]|uniref:N-acetylglutamate synthase-like GNAT family acetyltransferase n=1 Tax=Agrobacterium larrymoorei TaxID=160699 RepID=A0ABU0UP58_9HYPH|nr:arsenic resistance N-acetyltransferase ArsN2 [Agrobacterium larrymoorei]MDQ1186754.1 N-acetylglutamate synthase-like GNAT family acetyltransferase [Agrobacterium larrymoorei]
MPELILRQMTVLEAQRKALEAEGLLVEDLEGPDRRYFSAANEEGHVVGYSGLEYCDEKNALLRSVVVLPSFRSQGLGRKLVELMLAEVHPSADVYLVTTSAADFFESIGFARISRDATPQAILSTRQLSGLCPASATVMKLSKSQT